MACGPERCTVRMLDSVRRTELGSRIVVVRWRGGMKRFKGGRRGAVTYEYLSCTGGWKAEKGLFLFYDQRDINIT